MLNLENNTTVLYENLITAFLPSCPFLLVHNSTSPEFFFYITCFNEEQRTDFYFLKQMKLKITMENLALTHTEPMFQLGFILLHVPTQHNNICWMFWRA